MNYLKRLETIFIAVVILVLGVAYGMMNDKQYPLPAGEDKGGQSQTQPTSLPDNVRARYEGQDGKTALELLKSYYQVETESFGDMGEFVTAINGEKPDSRHFWALYINGQQSQVGAGTYVSKNSDMIDWRLEEIK